MRFGDRNTSSLVMDIQICSVCKQDQPRYKCPTCRNAYCSAACCKAHKVGNCKLLEMQTSSCGDKINSDKSNAEYEFPTEDTVPVKILEELRQSRELKLYLQNPHVRDIMKAILNDSNPSKAIGLAMTEPIFVEMADSCLRVVEPNLKDGPR